MALHMIKKVPGPQEIREAFPMDKELLDIKAARDAEIKKIFTGESDKFIAIIGPCSADYEDSVLDYLGRLAKVQEKVEEKIETMEEYVTYHVHVVGSNDSVENIMKLYNTNLDMLNQYNDIKELKIGDKVIIPEYNE